MVEFDKNIIIYGFTEIDWIRNINFITPQKLKELSNI